MNIILIALILNFTQIFTTEKAPHQKPIHVATYLLLQHCLTGKNTPLEALYSWQKKSPTIYDLFNSSHFLALQDAPLKEGDAIRIDSSQILDSKGSKLFFSVRTESNRMIPDENNPHLLICPLAAGNVLIYSGYEYASDCSTEYYFKNVEKRDDTSVQSHAE